MRLLGNVVPSVPLGTFVNITAAGAVDGESGGGHIARNPGFSWIFVFFLLGFGVREVSQRRDLEILVQVGSGRARDDFKKLRSGTGTIPTFRRFEDFV